MDIAWITPPVIEGGGGFYNILFLSKYLAKFGHKITIYYDGPDSPSIVREKVEKGFAVSTNISYRSLSEGIGNHQICIATFWTTAYMLQQNINKIQFPFYFVQDYEPMFYPMGTNYLLSKETYSFGYTMIACTPLMGKMLKEKHNLEVSSINFPLNKDVYNVTETNNSERTGIAFFFRPDTPRKCSELGIAALRLVSLKRPHVPIYLFGFADTSQIPFKHINAWATNVDELAKLYKKAELGIAFSTIHYCAKVPYEMMACGLAVANFNFDEVKECYGGDKNAFYLHVSPEEMAKDILNILDDDEERNLRALNGYNFVQQLKAEEQVAREFEKIIMESIK